MWRRPMKRCAFCGFKVTYANRRAVRFHQARIAAKHGRGGQVAKVGIGVCRWLMVRATVFATCTARELRRTALRRGAGQ
jgi:hypothetical protein